MFARAALVAALAIGVIGCGDDTTTPAAPTLAPSTAPTTPTSAPTTTAGPPTTASPSTTIALPASPSATELCALSQPTDEAVVVESAVLTEISGLAASRQHDGLLWAHNDSGGSARLHLIDTDTGADLGAWSLTGAGAFDWEDMSIATDPDGGHHLLAADFGDNFRIRGDIRIYRSPEPADVATPAALETEEFVFTYPDGATDAESFFIDPQTGDFIIVSKSRDDSPTTIYRGPADTPVETPTELERIGEVDLTAFHPLATAADITAGGRVIGLRTPDEVLLWDRSPGVDVGSAMATAPCVAPSADEVQGESLAFLPDGTGYITISEGANPPVHRFEID